MRDLVLVVTLVTSTFALVTRASSEITKVTYERTAFEDGRVFGTVGPYEKISGRLFGELDPNDPRNSVIVDLDKAPRNASGRVEYEAEFVVLRPADASKANGTLLHTVPNRGNFRFPSPFQFERGYTMSWVAWQGDILPGNNRLLMKVPVATENGRPITGRVRTEHIVEQDGVATVALGNGPYTGDSHAGYEAASTDASTATLTMREYQWQERIAVRPDSWSFGNCPDYKPGQPIEPSASHLCLPEGFRRGFIYELVYDAKNPRVMAVGLASTRDALSFFRFAGELSGRVNPLFEDGESIVKRVIMTGASQTGRYCRQFLYTGFHRDEQDRVVVEGLWPHITAARLPINMRFAAPGRAFLQHEEHSLPSYEFPIAYNVMKDAFSERVDGVLRHCGESKTCPKVVHTVSASEYWQERASLDTTDALGKIDLELPDNVRFYLISSTQHGPAAKATRHPLAKHMTNPAPNAETMRALLVALDDWIQDGPAPPDSAYPRLSDKTLVMPERASTGFPEVPGVAYPRDMNDLDLLDFGPDFVTKGIITNHPPKVVPGKTWRPMVPKVDADGNDIAGIRSVTLRVPLGTHTGWNIRTAEAGAEGEMYRLDGSFIPFARTKAERDAAGDPRLSLEERYGDHDGYLQAVADAEATSELVASRLQLEEDAARIIREAGASAVLK